MNNHISFSKCDKSILYVLREVRTGTIYAISEYEEYITNYIKLFDGYFKDGIDKSKYQIDIVRGKSQVDYYLVKYQDCYLFSRGSNNGLTLTEWEWNYYGPFFKELYDRAKDTIVNLKVFHDIYGYGISNKIVEVTESMHNLSYKFYAISQGLYEFVGNIPIEFIKQEVLLEPIKAHKFNKMLEETEYKYRQALS